MTVAYVSLTLTGGVRLVSQSKNLSKKEIKLRIEDAQKVFTSCPDYTNDVETKESECIQKINVSSSMYNDIITGNAKPSNAAFKQYGLLIQGKNPDWTRWKKLSPYAKLELFYSDIASDLQATSMKIHFIA